MAGLVTPTTPTLAIFAGLPGSGKTALAQPLAAVRGWAYLNRDEIRAQRFMNLGPEAWKPVANAAVEAAAREALAAGRSVVVDGATFAAGALRERFARAAADQGAHFVTVWVDCPVEEAIRRVARSNATHPAPGERDAARVREVAARFEPPSDAIRLDAMQPLPDLRAALLAALDARSI
ncbi:MAG TPA: ATP-binding protein [Solimonas sp.]